MATTEHVEYPEREDEPIAAGNTAESRESIVTVTPIKDTKDDEPPVPASLDDPAESGDSEDTLKPPERTLAWFPLTNYPTDIVMPMNKLATPEPIIALNVKEAEVGHTFFVHTDLLGTSKYFQDLFVANPGLTEHTLPPGPDVKTVGNYVSILYTHAHAHSHTHVRPLSLPRSDGRTALSQIISLARVYRISSKLCLNHIWVMNSAYNAAKDVLQNLDLAWGPGEVAQTMRQLQSAFLEWSADYGPWTNSRNIARKIVETFVKTCPDLVFEMHAELLDRKFLNAIALQLMRLARKLETDLIDKIPASPGAAGHRVLPASLMMTPSVATATAGPSALQSATNTNVNPPVAVSPEVPARRPRRHARSASVSCVGEENLHNRYNPNSFR